MYLLVQLFCNTVILQSQKNQTCILLVIFFKFLYNIELFNNFLLFFRNNIFCTIVFLSSFFFQFLRCLYKFFLGQSCAFATVLSKDINILNSKYQFYALIFLLHYFITSYDFRLHQTWNSCWTRNSLSTIILRNSIPGKLGSSDLIHC